MTFVRGEDTTRARSDSWGFMRRYSAIYTSVVGKKAIVAVTGAILLGFLVLHGAGNLKVFLANPAPGVPDIDVYARFLRTMGEPLLPREALLWTVRIVLAVSLFLHVLCVAQLAQRNRLARPVPYQRSRPVRATLPARSMLVTGVVILFFIVVHLLQFTTGTIDSARFVEGAVYANLYRAFQVGYYAAFYLVVLSFLALHLHHGAWSLFQTLGVDNPDRNPSLRRLAIAITASIFLIFASVPIAFYSGAMPAPPAVSPSSDGTKG